jgi:hypothetical protein
MLLARYESLEHSSINLEHVKHWKDSSDLIVRIVWLEDIQGAKNKLIMGGGRKILYVSREKRSLVDRRNKK